MRTHLLLMLSVLLTSCDDATSVRVMNDTDAAIVNRLWWQTTLFTTPVEPHQRSAFERTVPASDFAYALLTSTTGDAGTLLPIRSRERLNVERGAALELDVNTTDWLGFCDAGQPLTQDEADFITQRIFVTQFADQTFEAASCTLRP